MFPEANQDTSHLVLWAADPLWLWLAHGRGGLQSDCVPRSLNEEPALPSSKRQAKGMWRQNHFATRNETSKSNRDLPPRPPPPLPHLFLLRMVLPDKKYRRKAQLLSAVPFCEFSHTKLCTGCCDALCYYDRKKWISNVLPLPAAGSLWIFRHQAPWGHEPEWGGGPVQRT